MAPFSRSSVSPAACPVNCALHLKDLLLPRVHVGPVSGVIMAVRILAVIAGPVLGGYLYQAGCWAMPFTVGASVLALTALVLTLALGRAAPRHLPPPAEEMTLFAKLRAQQGFTPQYDKIMKKAVESGTIQTQIKVFEKVCRRRMN